MRLVQQIDIQYFHIRPRHLISYKLNSFKISFHNTAENLHDQNHDIILLSWQTIYL